MSCILPPNFMIRTKPNEFIKFHKILMSNAPKNYIPWYFPVVKNNKAPDGIAIAKRAPNNHTGSKGNWKAIWARLTYEETLSRLESGKNIGLSARANDPLIIIDIDDWNYINQIPITLTILSRKRCGIHGFCWKKSECNKLPINIPTEYGEVRSSDQYVVAAGSYCTTSKNDINKEKISEKLKKTILNDKMLGVYSIYKAISPSYITFDDLPNIFKERLSKKEKNIIKSTTIKPKGKHSALFDLNITDIISISPGRREPHPLHASDTGMNFSIGNGVAHCWRHLVSLNAIQFLVVKSGYMSCLEAGTGHRGSGAGFSNIVNNNGAIFYAWLQAKKDRFIPSDDPIPLKAMIYVALHHNLIKKYNPNTLLPIKIYNKVIKIVENEY